MTDPLRETPIVMLPDRTPEQWKAIHEADCKAVTGRAACGYECLRCGLCTKWSHHHVAPGCQGHEREGDDA